MWIRLDYDSPRSRPTHPQSHPLTVTIVRTVLKESDDLDILDEKFDSKMTFWKHLCSISRAASQILCILKKSSLVFHDRLLLGSFCLAYFEVLFCSGVLRFRYTPLTGGPCSHWCQFSNWGCVWVWYCTMVELWLYHGCCTRSGVIRCTLFMVLFLCRLCQWERVTCGALVAHQYTYACTSSLQNLAVYCRTFILQDFYSPVSISMERSWCHRIWRCGTGGFKSMANAFLLA